MSDGIIKTMIICICIIATSGIVLATFTEFFGKGC